MTEAQTINQQVLATFLETIVDEGGWWFRVPKGPVRGPDDPTIHMDAIMPLFGSVFGLTEEAAQSFYWKWACYN